MSFHISLSLIRTDADQNQKGIEVTFVKGGRKQERKNEKASQNKGEKKGRK